jgi:hypothetical protein
MSNHGPSLHVGTRRRVTLPEGIQEGTKISFRFLQGGALLIIPDGVKVKLPEYVVPVKAVPAAKSATPKGLDGPKRFYIYRTSRFWKHVNKPSEVLCLYRLYAENGKLVSILPIPAKMAMRDDAGADADRKGILRAEAEKVTKLHGRELELHLVTEKLRKEGLLPKVIADRLDRDDNYKDRGLKFYKVLDERETMNLLSGQSF